MPTRQFKRNNVKDGVFLMGIFSRNTTPGIFSRNGGPARKGQITPSRTRMALELRHNAALLACRFDPTGRFIFASSQDNTLQRWDLNDRAKVTFTGHRSWVRGMAFHAESRKLLSTDYNGKI